ncbi:MAG: GatB/YqeY domain-containing protein [Anaerolineales bacterium]
MDIKQQLESDMKDAMRAKDELRKRTLRMALSAIRFAEIEKGGSLDDQAIYTLLQKEIKSRHESISDAERAGRADLVEEFRAEIDVLEAYLPKPFTEQELEQLARRAIQEAGATSPKEMGQVMKILMPQLQGRATGSEASQVVRSLLEGQG